VFCGIDWAEDHHDIALVDETGALLARRRITDDADGYRELLEASCQCPQEHVWSKAGARME